MWIAGELRPFMATWVHMVVAVGTGHKVQCGCTTCVHARYELGWY